MSITVNISEAKMRFSELLAAAERGEEVVIARAGNPVARLVPIGPAMPPGPRVPGSLKGKIWMSPDFDAPLPPDELARWYDSPLVSGSD